MHIVGEPITLITVKGAGVDDYGYPLPEKFERVVIENCAVVPGTADVITDESYMIAVKEVTVLAPVFLERVEDGARVIIRGEEWKVSEPVFHHRSVFGTQRGGTAIKCERRAAT